MKRAAESADIKSGLGSWLADAEKVVVAGIGNPMRRDDFVGIEILRRLRGKVSDRVYLVECETIPESFMEPIVEFNPTHILLIDAALIGLNPGASKLIEPENLSELPAVFTHALPLRIFCEYLQMTTNAKIALLAIQPKNADFGEGLTSEVKNTAEKMANLLLKLFP